MSENPYAPPIHHQQPPKPSNLLPIAGGVLAVAAMLLMFVGIASGALKSPEEISTARFRKDTPAPVWGFVSCGLGVVCLLAGGACGGFAAHFEHKKRQNQRLAEAQARLNAFNSGQVQ